jgi:hypothetical protein
MSEHLIRLRGGWHWLDPGPGTGGADPLVQDVATGRPVTLPIRWPADPVVAGCVHLVRSFGPPPLNPADETLVLRLADVGGLVAVRLNGREIARPAPGTTALDIPLPAVLPRRNLLILDVNPPQPDPARNPWGAIALVIRARTAAHPEEALGGSHPPA